MNAYDKIKDDVMTLVTEIERLRTELENVQSESAAFFIKHASEVITPTLWDEFNQKVLLPIKISPNE